MKKILTTLTIWLLAMMTQATEITTVKQAINLSGKERMLTRRILADYAMIGMHGTFQAFNGDTEEI